MAVLDDDVDEAFEVFISERFSELELELFELDVFEDDELTESESFIVCLELYRTNGI